jgi:hypothetical protein
VNNFATFAFSKDLNIGGLHMKIILIGLGMTLAAATIASAAEVTVEKKVERPAVTVPLPVPGVGVERRERVETTGRATGCETKSVTKESPGESKSVTKSNC